MKINNIVRHHTGTYLNNPDGTKIIKSGIVLGGKYRDLLIKIRARENGVYSETIVIKIHLGQLKEPGRF